MSKPLAFVKASDGSAATGMNVALYGQWVATKIGQPISFQVEQGAGVTGVWSAQGTNAEDPDYTATPDDMPSALYWRVPTQPAGSAGQTSITVQATHEHTRLKYTPTSGGSGVVPVGVYALGAGGVLVMPPDVANVPASNAAALAALAGSSSTLLALPAAVATKAEASAMASALAGKASLVDGLVSAAVLPAASGAAQGALSAAGFSKLASQAPGGWAAARWNEMLASEPTLTDPYPMLGINGGMVAPTLPADLTWVEDEQGGHATVTADSTWRTFGPKLFSPTTAPLAMAFEVTLPSRAVDRYEGLGISLPASGAVNINKMILLSSFGAHAMTNFELCYYAGGEQYLDTGIPLDTAKHNLTFVFAPTSGNFVLWIDGFAVVTSPLSGKITSAAQFYATYYSMQSGAMKISKMMAGWRRPT